MPETLCGNLRDKIDEQIERAVQLIARLPPESIEAAPVPGAWPVGRLLGHLLDSMAGVVAVLAAAHPESLAHLRSLRALPVNHACAPAEAIERAGVYRTAIAEGFSAFRDADLGRRIPTVFVPEGETALTLLLGNLEHLINHKHELFTCLKLMGIGVGTADLYRLRGAGG